LSGNPPAGWPPGVTQISVEDLEHLGIDSRDRLFWDGKRVEVRQAVVLTGLQKLLAFIIAICAVLGGVGGFVTGLNNGSVFLCARGHYWLSCPEQLPIPAPPSSVLK
jgi:hypothetical protein